MPAWSSQLSDTDRWNLVNYLRSVDGRGPSPAPSAVVAPPALAGIGLGGTIAAALLGWLGVGLRRSRRPSSAVDAGGQVEAGDPHDPGNEQSDQTLR